MADYLKRGDVENYINDSDLDVVFRNEFPGIDIPVAKEECIVWPEAHVDTLLVVQYHGFYLPEGATKLPIDAKIEYWLVCSEID